MDVELGTVTLLMVDQVGSTEQLQAMGDTAGQSIRAQLLDGLLDVVATHRGTLVDTTGDGFLAHFPGAALALDAARSCMAFVAVSNRRVDARERCELRAGVHTGDPLVDGSGRLHGMAVVITARLCAAADSGQILASDITRALVANRPEFGFDTPATLQLKGVAEPVTAAGVRWELPVDEQPDTGQVDPIGVDDRFAFVGRSQELDAMAEAVADACAGHRRVVALSGEPGVGKTRLAAEAVTRVVDQGGTAGIGVCDEDVQAPFQPIIDALSAVLRSAEPTVVEDIESRWGPALAMLRPGDARGSADAGDRRTPERQQWFADMTAALRTLSAHRPMCLLLDDIQWATADTVALVRHLIRATGSDRLLVLLTYRDSDVSRDHPLSPFLADLHRIPGCTQILLDGLAVDDVVALAEAAAGHPLAPREQELARRVHAESGGSPFYVTEMILNLIEAGTIINVDGRWRVASDGVELPVSVRDVVLRRIGRLPETAQRLLGVAAVAGYAFELEVLVGAGDVDEDHAIDLVETAIAADLVDEVGADRFRFRHRLTRDILYDELSATRRSRMHRRIAETLEALHAEDSHVEDLAYHWSEATQLSDAARVAQYCRLAGERARSRRAPEDAARFFDRAAAALDAADDVDPRTRFDVMLSLGQVERELGDGHAREHLDAAVAEARRLGDHERLARAVLSMLRAGAFFTDTGTEDADLIALIDEVLPKTTGTARARLLSARASERHWVEETSKLRTDSDEAVQLARESRDLRTLAEVLLGRCVALGGPDFTADRVAWAQEAAIIAREMGSAELEAIAVLTELTARYELGDATCLDELPALFAMTEQVTNRFTIWCISMFKATRTIMLDPEDGEQRALEAYEIAEASHQPDGVDGLGMQLADVYWHTGRLGDIVDLYREAVDGRPSITALRSGYARVLLELGRDRAAADELARLEADGFDPPRDMVWLGAVADFALVAAHLGTADQQARAYEVLKPFEHRQILSVWFLTANGSAARTLGLLANALGRPDDAKTHLEYALDLEERFGHRVWVDRCRSDLRQLVNAPVEL